MHKALKNSTGDYVLNGNYIVTAFRKEIKVKGSVIEYSGSDTAIERINSTRMIREDIYVYVCYAFCIKFQKNYKNMNDIILRLLISAALFSYALS